MAWPKAPFTGIWPPLWAPAPPGHWDRQEARLLPLRAALRRNLGAETLEALTAEAVDILHTLCTKLDLATEKTAGTAAIPGVTIQIPTQTLPILSLAKKRQ